MKNCKKCGESKNKDEFYSSQPCECKSCTRKRVTANRLKNLEYYREFDRARANAPERIQARQEYTKTKEYKISHIKANEKYRINHKIKRYASGILSKAVASNKIVREPCLICGDLKTEGHHYDYRMPVNVIWLCDTHHKQAHIIANEIHRQMDLIA